MRRTSLLISFVGLAMLSGLAHAGPRGEAGVHGFPPLLRMVRALELTPEQEQTVRQIMADAQPRFKALREGARETRQALMTTTPDDPNFAATVAEASQASAANATELVTLMSDVRVQVYALLTDEQKAKAGELMASVAERGRRFQRRGWRGRRSGCQPEDGPPEA